MQQTLAAPNHGPMVLVSDQDPVDAAVPERLQALYRAHAPAVVTRLRRMCGDPDLARDLTQDAFVVAMRRIDEVKDDPPPVAWLHAIAYNLLRDHRRTRQRRARLLSWLQRRGARPAALVGEGPGAATPSLTERLEAALGQLSDKQRDAFVLRVVEGVSLADAAEILGTSVQTISYCTRKAEEVVRAHLDAGASR